MILGLGSLNLSTREMLVHSSPANGFLDTIRAVRLSYNKFGLNEFNFNKLRYNFKYIESIFNDSESNFKRLGGQIKFQPT